MYFLVKKNETYLKILKNKLKIVQVILKSFFRIFFKTLLKWNLICQIGCWVNPKTFNPISNKTILEIDILVLKNQVNKIPQFQFNGTKQICKTHLVSCDKDHLSWIVYNVESLGSTLSPCIGIDTLYLPSPLSY